MKRRRQESGFALLLVFLMASTIAITLYMQMPRAAFENQRGKEELLQERGEQYIRAIQLYVAKWRSYPPSLDALEKTNNIRFLRKRYKDPLTGKDEWRTIHVNAAGQLTDSIIQKKTTDQKPAYQNNFVSELPSMGATNGPGDNAQNIALRRRPSDQNPMPGAGGNGPVDMQSLGHGPQVVPVTDASGGQAPGQMPPNQMPPNQTQAPVMNPRTGQLIQQPAGEGQTGQPVAPQQPLRSTQSVCTARVREIQPDRSMHTVSRLIQTVSRSIQTVSPLRIASPTNPYGQPGQAIQPGQPNPYGQQQNLNGQPNPYGQQGTTNGNSSPTIWASHLSQRRPGTQSAPTTGYPTSSAIRTQGNPANRGSLAELRVQPRTPGHQNQGLDMINKILTTPRSGMNMAIPGAPGLQVGGGIAGFASKVEAPSIKIYTERQKYNEWEFVYDMKKGQAHARVRPRDSSRG